MEIEHLVPTDQLKTALLSRFISEHKLPIVVDYEDIVDALTLRIVPLEVETVVHYIDEHIALLYEAESYEIVGLQIEDFEFTFHLASANSDRS